MCVAQIAAKREGAGMGGGLHAAGCGGHNRHKDGFSGSWGWLIALLVLRFFCVSRVFLSPCVFIMSFVCIRFQFLMHSCERVCVCVYISVGQAGNPFYRACGHKFC